MAGGAGGFETTNGKRLHRKGERFSREERKNRRSSGTSARVISGSEKRISGEANVLKLAYLTFTFGMLARPCKHGLSQKNVLSSREIQFISLTDVNNAAEECVAVPRGLSISLGPPRPHLTRAPFIRFH